MKSIVGFSIAFFWILQLAAQDPRADRLFEKAEQAYGRRDYTQAIRHIEDVIKQYPAYLNAYLLKGDIYYDLKMQDLAAEAYSKAISIDSVSFPPVYYILAGLQFEMERFEEAKRNYMIYLGFHPKSQTEIQKAERNIYLCEVRSELKKHPVPFNPVNLGPHVNSDGYEYINSVSLDEEILLFTRKGLGPNDHESFYHSGKVSGNWRPSQPMDPPVNSPGNQGALCLSPDGMLLFMTCCSRRDSYGTCDLYVSRRRGTLWSEPLNLGETINSTAWDSQPCLSSDGRTLYFVSTRRGGHGGSDIWKSTLLPSNEWSLPENLGDTINTSANEMAPFIHQDGKTLYFSSAGHPGMGGADLFMSRLSANGTWSKPMNLGYPVNTKNDEINLIINAGGDAAYISSAKEGGYGNTDIYRFELPVEVRPSKVTYVKGKVYDKTDRRPLAATFELIDLQTGLTVVNSVSDGLDGSFLLSLPIDKDYALNVSCQGYLFYSMNFSVSGGEEPVFLDVPMQPLQVGESVVLKNIFFDTDKFELKPESSAELDKLYSFLVKNPSLRIEIGGHTDNVGSDAHNLELSQNRALAVFSYLAGKGVAKERLTAKGYGKSMPVDTNETPEGRANNRRTEFKVISK